MDKIDRRMETVDLINAYSFPPSHFFLIKFHTFLSLCNVTELAIICI